MEDIFVNESSKLHFVQFEICNQSIQTLEHKILDITCIELQVLQIIAVENKAENRKLYNLFLQK